MQASAVVSEGDRPNEEELLAQMANGLYVFLIYGNAYDGVGNIPHFTSVCTASRDPG